MSSDHTQIPEGSGNVPAERLGEQGQRIVQRPTVVLAQCTNQKRDGQHRAKHLYDPSTYFKKQRKYARLKGDWWLIQSAEHGLVDPNSTVESYDTHVDDLEDAEAWAADIAETLAAGPASPPGTVVLLGGKKYAGPLVPELEARGYDAVEPLRGLGIGERMSKLDDMAQEELNETLPR